MTPKRDGTLKVGKKTNHGIQGEVHHGKAPPTLYVHNHHTSRPPEDTPKTGRQDSKGLKTILLGVAARCISSARGRKKPFRSLK